jgi:hypothetical protein
MIKAGAAWQAKERPDSFCRRIASLLPQVIQKLNLLPAVELGFGLSGDVSCGPLRSGGSQVQSMDLHPARCRWVNATEPSLFGWIELIIGLIITASSAVFEHLSGSTCFSALFRFAVSDQAADRERQEQVRSEEHGHAMSGEGRARAYEVRVNLCCTRRNLVASTDPCALVQRRRVAPPHTHTQMRPRSSRLRAAEVEWGGSWKAFLTTRTTNWPLHRLLRCVTVRSG